MRQRIMSWIENTSMRNIMLIFSCLAFIPITLIYSVSHHYVNKNALHRYMTETWQRQVNQIAELTTFAVMTHSPEQAKATVSIFEINQQILHLNIFSHDQSIYTFGKAHFCQNNHTASDYFESPSYWCFHAPVTERQTRATIGGIQIIVSKMDFNRMVYQNLLINMTMIFLLFFVILFLIFYLTQMLTHPLTIAVDVMSKTQKGSRGLRIDTHGPQEIQSIQESFNDMIHALERHETKLESLVAERTLELTHAYLTAQDASRVKSDILHIVSHEMKTPLHNIKLPLEIFLADHKDIEDSHIKTALSSVAKLNALIQDLLVYAKGVSKTITPTKTKFSLNTLLAETKQEITPLAENKGNRVLIKNTPILDLFSDEKMLRQIILNLLSNANKFTSNGTIEISCQQQKDQIVVSISDTGCGIEKDKISLIFQPFYQADMSQTRSFSGTGLGLAICKLFAEALSGSISVDSQFNTGSTFFLIIPTIQN